MKIPTIPNCEIPMKIPMIETSGWIEPYCWLIIGLRILSIRLMNIPTTIKATPMFVFPERNCINAAGIQIIGAPMRGRNDRIIVTAPQNSAFGIPRSQKFNANNPPWIIAIRKVPTIVA